MIFWIPIALGAPGWVPPGDHQPPGALPKGWRDARVADDVKDWSVALGPNGELWIATLESNDEVVLRTRRGGLQVVRRMPADESVQSVAAGAAGRPVLDRRRREPPPPRHSDALGLPVFGEGELAAVGLPIRTAQHEGTEYSRTVLSGWCDEPGSPDPGPTSRIRTGPCADGSGPDGPSPLDHPYTRLGESLVIDGVVPKIVFSSGGSLYIVQWRAGEWWGLDGRPGSNGGLPQSVLQGQSPVFVGTEPMRVRWMGFHPDHGAEVQEAVLDGGTWQSVAWERPSRSGATCSDGAPVTHWEPIDNLGRFATFGALCGPLGAFEFPDVARLVQLDSTGLSQLPMPGTLDGLDWTETGLYGSTRSGWTRYDGAWEKLGVNWGSRADVSTSGRVAISHGPDGLQLQRRTGDDWRAAGTVSTDPTVYRPIVEESADGAVVAAWSGTDRAVTLARAVGERWSVERVATGESSHRVALSVHGERVVAAWSRVDGVHARTWTDGAWRPIGTASSDRIWSGEAGPDLDVVIRDEDVCVAFSGLDLRGDRIGVLCHPW